MSIEEINSPAQMSALEKTQELLDLKEALEMEVISKEEYFQGVAFICFGTPVPDAK